VIELSDANAGSSHQLSQGEELHVRLPENPTTGYRWQFTQTGGGTLRVVEDRFEPGGAGTPAAAGASGIRVVRFAAENSGNLTLEATERREWEPASAHSKKKTYSIVVR
jgi:inhibitor of cysteine peptidase